MKYIIIGALLGGATNALTYRPSKDEPWFHEVKHTREPEFAYDYPVASFGVDRDIEVTNNNLAGSEKKLKHKFNVAQYASDRKPFEYPDYTVPNFGVDKDIVTSTKNLAESQTKMGITWSDADALKMPAKYPRNYKVANFGPDRVLAGEFENLSVVEKKLKHKLSIKNDAPKPLPAVARPNFGLDSDIKATLKNLADTETRLGLRFNPEFVQTYMELSM